MSRIGSLGLVLSGILAASGAARGATATPGLVETVEGFEKLQIASESAPVVNLKLTSSRFECVLTSGRASFVKAGADVVGVYFEGSGAMEYVSTDPIEMPVVTYVAKKSSGLKPEKTDKGVRLRDKFTKLLWIAAGGPRAAHPGRELPGPRGGIPPPPRLAALLRLRAPEVQRPVGALSVGRDGGRRRRPRLCPQRHGEPL
jgi:hypothetical protein